MLSFLKRVGISSMSCARRAGQILLAILANDRVKGLSHPITIVHYWAGCLKSPNSKCQRFLALVKRCRAQGWRNCIVWSRMPEDRALAEPFEEAGCDIVLRPRSRGNFDVSSVWRTFRLLRRLKCDIFHCHNDHTSPLIGAALARVPVRIWSKLSMSYFYERGETPRGLRKLHPSNRVSSWCSHRVLALTEAVRREFLGQGGSGAKSVVVPAPADVERFGAASGAGVREKLGLADSYVIIAAVGHAVPVKGWDILIKSFTKLSADKRNLCLLLVGGTTAPNERAFAESLRSLALAGRYSSRVHFLGHRTDIAEILKASNIFVLPSRSEGQGLALVEAMAAGLPCVAARVGGIPEVITDGEDGLLFERENVEELTRHLAKLIEDEALRNRFASRSLERAEAFSMGTYVDRVFDCYRSLLNGVRL